MSWYYYLGIVLIGLLSWWLGKRDKPDCVSKEWISEHYTASGHEHDQLVRRER